MNASDERTYRITVTPHEWQFEASAVRPILDSARVAGIALPKSCRNGTCRHCMCPMPSGTVHYRIEWPGISAEEKAEGYILPCIAYPDSDAVIDVRGARRIDKKPGMAGTDPASA